MSGGMSGQKRSDQDHGKKDEDDGEREGQPGKVRKMRPSTRRRSLDVHRRTSSARLCELSAFSARTSAVPGSEAEYISPEREVHPGLSPATRRDFEAVLHDRSTWSHCPRSGGDEEHCQNAFRFWEHFGGVSGAAVVVGGGGEHAVSDGHPGISQSTAGT